MKNVFYLLLLTVCFYSCKKTDSVPAKTTATTKLKRIISAPSTVVCLGSGCMPVISQKFESFNYDAQDRLSTRVIWGTTVYMPDTTRIIDTSVTFTYNYSGNSSRIISYTEKNKTLPIILHQLTYDSQGRLIADSITNPQQGNNKVSRFTYLQDTLIEYERNTYIVGTEITIDTLVLSGNNVTKEKAVSAYVGSASVYTRENAFTLSSYRNPLSYVNNFELHASDYKNGGSTLFRIYTSYDVTYNMTSSVLVKYWSNPASPTQYVTTLTITVDSLGRVASYANSSNAGAVTSFEYY